MFQTQVLNLVIFFYKLLPLASAADFPSLNATTLIKAKMLNIFF